MVSPSTHSTQFRSHQILFDLSFSVVVPLHNSFLIYFSHYHHNYLSNTQNRLNIVIRFKRLKNFDVSVNRIQYMYNSTPLHLAPISFSNLCSCITVLFIPPKQNASLFHLCSHGSVFTGTVTALNSFCFIKFLACLSFQLE